jgi:uncharacterized membrane protein YozB (DUF420 family)
MTDLLHADGFLGTSANFAADITLLLSLLVAVTFTGGAVLARRQRYEAHRWVQTTGVGLNLVLVLWMMILPYRDFVVVDWPVGTRPGYFYVMTTIHAIVGGAALLFGLFVTLRGNHLMIKPLRFNNYRPFMRAAFGLYMLATLAGIGVYLTWFVIVPNPPQF